MLARAAGRSPRSIKRTVMVPVMCGRDAADLERRVRGIRQLFSEFGALPLDSLFDELREMFSPHGRVVSATVCTDRETGRSRGFGFVELAEGAEEAIAALNTAQFGGRSLTVNEAKPREDRPAAGVRSGSGAGRGYSRSY